MDACVVQAIPFCHRFYAFGDHFDLQVCAQRYKAFHDRLLGTAIFNSPHQVHVDLDDVGLEVRQQLQA